MLSELIRINTTNPPGNERAACDYLLPRYEALGLTTVVVEPEPERGSIIGRLRAPDSADQPLLLLSHLDVVPAENEGWSHPPFSGVRHDDYIYGRGALDCKNAAVAEYFALKLFRESGRELRRDVILAATADEEAGGGAGVEWICNHQPGLLDAGHCINEGGGFGYKLGEREIYFCQTAEKGVCWFKLSSRGLPGHASAPGDGQAMERMLDALDALRGKSPEVSICKTMRKLVEAVAKALGADAGAARLDDRSFAELLTGSARSEEMKKIFRALTRNTLAVTMVHGGNKANVIPARVEATIDCRIVPGYDPEKLVAEIREIAAPFGVEVEPLVLSTGAEIEPGGKLYQALESSLKKARPGAGMAPFMVPGGTDGRFLVDRGVSVCGFIPVLAEAGGDVSVFRRAHGMDERVSVHDLAFAVRVLYETLVKFCAKK